MSYFHTSQTKQPTSPKKNKYTQIMFSCVFLVVILSFFVASTAYAISNDGNNFIPLVGIPYIDNPNNITSLAQYINALYKISITIAAFLAVVKIIFAGVKYMLSDVVTTKEDAKKDIKGALLGLLIVVGAVLILNTINPNLTSLTALQGIEGVGIGLNSTKTIPAIKIGERLLMCPGDVTSAEIKHFNDTCPGIKNTVMDSSSGCAVLICDTEATPEAELDCSGDTCTCDFSEIGSSACYSACRIQPNFIEPADINNTTNTITCTYAKEEDIVGCTQNIGCCSASSLGTCVIKDYPDVCNQKPHPSIPGQVCFYRRPLE